MRITKQDGMDRLIARSRRLIASENKQEEITRIKEELIAEGFSEDSAVIICRETWGYAKKYKDKL